MIELLLQAERALSVGMLDGAETMYQQVAAADPRNSIAVVGLARVALERGDEDDALALGMRALAIDPENAAAQRLVQRLEEVRAYRADPNRPPAVTRMSASELESEASNTSMPAPEPAPTGEPEPEPTSGPVGEPEPGYVSAAESESEPASGPVAEPEPGYASAGEPAPGYARAPEPEPEVASEPVAESAPLPPVESAPEPAPPAALPHPPEDAPESLSGPVATEPETPPTGTPSANAERVHTGWRAWLRRLFRRR